MDETLFYVLGGALVVTALGLSAVGVRWREGFPSQGVMLPLTVALVLLVCGSGTFAVLAAQAEQEHREQELAEEEAEAEEALGEEAPEAAGEAKAPGQPEGGQPPGSGAPAESATELAITSPEDGGLAFEPDGLDAEPGEVTIAYENPSLITHNVALEDQAGELIAESEDVAEGTVSVEAQLVPGEYAFFCTIPGHREGGMEGVLTVGAGQAE